MFPEYDALDDDEKKERRTLVKTFAYGVSFGRTAEGIAKDPDFHMTVETAEEHLNLFKQQIPSLVEWQQREIIDRIHAGHDLVNPYGRHKRVWLLTDMNKDAVHRECLAFPSQSTASDMCLTAACRANDQGIHVVNLIHDAILFEAYPDEVEEQAKIVDRLMVSAAEEVVGDYVAFRTDYKIGKNWHEVR
jgi:DNA polymerase I-like protein with 3'-5' exonuclease and polymerase domains